MIVQYIKCISLLGFLPLYDVMKSFYSLNPFLLHFLRNFPYIISLLLNDVYVCSLNMVVIRLFTNLCYMNIFKCFYLDHNYPMTFYYTQLLNELI